MANNYGTTNALFHQAFGRNATRGELKYWENKQRNSLITALNKDPKVSAEFKKGWGNISKAVAPVTPAAAPVATTPAILSRADWLAQNQDQFGLGNDTALDKEFGLDASGNVAIDPNNFYGQQMGTENQNYLNATSDYGTGMDRTKVATGNTFNDRGLFGSGIYQNDLNQQLGDLTTGYNREWGTGPYTPYSLRKQQIIQNARTGRKTEALTRQGQADTAYDAYRTELTTGV